jgi:transcriptional regulator with XRE-family HTH domain
MFAAAVFPLAYCAAPPDVRALGERVHSRRLELGLSPDTVASQAGISRATVRRIERGIGNPTFDSVRRIAAWLDTHIGRPRFQLLDTTSAADAAGAVRSGQIAPAPAWLSPRRFSAAAFPVGAAVGMIPAGGVFTLDSLGELAARSGHRFDAPRHVVQSVVAAAARLGIVEFAGRGDGRGKPCLYRKIVGPDMPPERDDLVDSGGMEQPSDG